MNSPLWTLESLVSFLRSTPKLSQFPAIDLARNLQLDEESHEGRAIRRAWTGAPTSGARFDIKSYAVWTIELEAMAEALNQEAIPAPGGEVTPSGAPSADPYVERQKQRLLEAAKVVKGEPVSARTLEGATQASEAILTAAREKHALEGQKIAGLERALAEFGRKG
jgi:hypothetical protein